MTRTSRRAKEIESSDHPDPVSNWGSEGVTGTLTPENIREWRKMIRDEPEFFRIYVRARD